MPAFLLTSLIFSLLRSFLAWNWKCTPPWMFLENYTVLYLAAKLDAMVLSSDKAVRHNAKIRSIEYHGMLWIFDRLVEESLLSQEDASEKLKRLIMTNIIYQNNANLIREMNSRLKKWS